MAKYFLKTYQPLFFDIPRLVRGIQFEFVGPKNATQPTGAIVKIQSAKKYRIILLVILLLWLHLTHAAIYKTTDANGNNHFTDAPQADASIVTLKPVNHYTATNTSNKQTNTTLTEKSNPSVYKKFVIASPKDQDTLQNTNEVTIDLQLQPSLKTGDSIEFLLDGHALPSTTATNITLNELTRGEHKLQARLLSADKKALMTTSVVTIYVHQVSVAETK